MSLDADKKIPRIVLVGPTNVGKSALFNRLTGTRKAIVCDRPGVTVDRHELTIRRPCGKQFMFVDTGGVGTEARELPLGVEVEVAAEAAVQEAACILFVVDGTHDVGISEIEIATWLREKAPIDKCPVWIVANKLDSRKHDSNSYFSLGFEKIYNISAEHDIGVLDLWEDIEKLSDENEISESDASDDKVLQAKPMASPRVLVLGRPNVGKSTLLNTLLGSDRHVVSDVAGTTRDPIESEFVHKHGVKWMLCDTPGLRQPGRLERGVEWVAKEKLKEKAREADIALVLLEAPEGVTDLDASIVGMAIDFGLSVILVFNKWDKMRGDDASDKFSHFERSSDLKLGFASWCPKLRLSGLTGEGVTSLIKLLEKVTKERTERVQTSKLNQLFERKIRLHSHPIGPQGRPAKFYYLSQIGVSPPEFVLFSNISGKDVHFSYKRFITNSLREEFGFSGTPIKLHFKQAQ